MNKLQENIEEFIKEQSVKMTTIGIKEVTKTGTDGKGACGWIVTYNKNSRCLIDETLFDQFVQFRDEIDAMLIHIISQ